jgi:hypothetical protein
MLANNFMTPSALGLSEVEFQSLVKVLGMLERREIPEDQFTMRRVQHPCRTPACLCGWANHVSSGRAFPPAPPRRTFFGSDESYRPRWSDLPRPVLDLFGVGGGPADPVYAATTAQAAIALRSFLTRGEARWPEALATA